MGTVLLYPTATLRLLPLWRCGRMDQRATWLGLPRILFDGLVLSGLTARWLSGTLSVKHKVQSVASICKMWV